MNKRMIDDVRQVLMGELGLTREVVRKETERIVAECVEKHLRHMLQQEQFERIIVEKVGALLAEPTRAWPTTGRANVEALIAEAARAAAGRFIKDHVKIELGREGGGGA